LVFNGFELRLEVKGVPQPLPITSGKQIFLSKLARPLCAKSGRGQNALQEKDRNKTVSPKSNRFFA
jgi:hypothetical protein